MGGKRWGKARPQGFTEMTPLTCRDAVLSCRPTLFPCSGTGAEKGYESRARMSKAVSTTNSRMFSATTAPLMQNANVSFL